MHKTESNPNLKCPKNSNRKTSNNPLNQTDKKLLFSQSSGKFDNYKSFSTVIKNTI